MKIPDPSRRFVCRICQHETGHWPIGNGQIPQEKINHDNTESTFMTFNVVRCKDCGTTTYLIDTHAQPCGGDSYVVQTNYHPPLTKRIKPRWYNSLAKEYQQILSEVYCAIDNELLFLASSGTRTAIDKLMVDKIGDKGRFDEKLDKLVEDKIVDADEKAMLEAVIDAGSASAHRSYRPDEESIGHMMDILETIFFKLMIEPDQKKALKEKAQGLLQSTPKRKKA